FSRWGDELRLPRRAGLVEDVGQVCPHRCDSNTERISGLCQGIACEQAFERALFGGRKAEHCRDGLRERTSPAILYGDEQSRGGMRCHAPADIATYQRQHVDHRRVAVRLGGWDADSRSADPGLTLA